MNEHALHIPERMTKQLKFQHFDHGQKKKLVISTNWLRLFGFEPGTPTIERSLGKNQGLEILVVEDDLFGEPVKKVYQRTYKQRSNNPLESMLDIRHQDKLNTSFPDSCEKVHITFTHKRITIVPLSTIQQRAIEQAQASSNPYSVVAACTSGVDLHSLQQEGFAITSVIEWRPQEARDKTNLTETGVLSVLGNTPNIRSVYNEDINHLDVGRLARDLQNSPYTVFHASVQCDDFSNLKSKQLKERSLDNTDSTVDMTYDMLRIIEALTPPVVCIENVAGWAKSPVYDLFSLRMRRWGYREYLQIADARDYGGLTSRTRAYAVFSALDCPFAFEDPTPRGQQPIWPIIEEHLPECRDVTHSKALQDGKRVGRLRTITPQSTSAPTLTKSQEHMAKDSCAIEKNGRFYWPSENLIKRLMGISKDFDLSVVGKSIASEIVGQSIDVPHHAAVVRSIKRHIDAYLQAGAIAQVA